LERKVSALKDPQAILTAIIVAALAFSVTASVALNLLTTSKTVTSGGTITVKASADLSIYTDTACTQTATFVDWGKLKPGDTATKTIYIKNVGNTNIELGLATTDWSPPQANPAINLTWDKEGDMLTPSNAVAATLTLTVSASISSSITTFSFNIKITGTAPAQ
jgi:hypothetical protein